MRMILMILRMFESHVSAAKSKAQLLEYYEKLDSSVAQWAEKVPTH